VKNFADLTEREVLAVAISAEEEDSRIYMTFAEDLAERYPESARMFEEMAEEEKGHRHMLLEMYEQRFGTNLPPIRRDNVKGLLRRRPIWLTKNLSLDTIRKEVGTMEFEAERFYIKAAEQTQDVGVRRLLGDLAEAEKGHEKVAAKLTDQILSPDVRADEDKTRRRVFVLQYVQPGLAGLMDGSVSTLAPLFAAAFATHQNWQTFLVGLAASIGAGISMGFAEALSDDGSLTGRGSPWLRGLTCGAMTTPCPISFPTHGPTRSGSRLPSQASWCSSNYGRSPTFARDIWTRHSCRRRSRSCSAAPSYLPSAF
jgi:rubrerythrin